MLKASRRTLKSLLQVSPSTGNKLVVSWSNSSSSHTGFLPIEWLKENDYSMMIKQQAEAPPLVAVSECMLVCSSSFHHPAIHTESHTKD